MGSRGWARSLRRERSRLRRVLGHAVEWRRSYANGTTDAKEGWHPSLFRAGFNRDPARPAHIRDMFPTIAPWEIDAIARAVQGRIGGRSRTNPLLRHATR